MQVNWMFRLVLVACLLASGCRTTLSSLKKKSLPSVFPNILIDSNTMVSRYQPCEPSIAISPKNPLNMVAGAILNRTYQTIDGGQTWTLDLLESSYGVFGDPVILADYEGRFYYAHLADPSSGGRSSDSWLDRIVVQASEDGGKTWNNGAYAGHRPPADQDKHWLAVNPIDQTLYMTWTEFDAYGSNDPGDHSRILFARSRDQGLSWSDAIAISDEEGNCLDDDQTTEGAVPAVGPEGQIYVVWAYDEKLYFDRSEDDGDSWLDSDRVIGQQQGGWAIDIEGLYRANGMPVTAVDLSQSPYRGTIYVNYCDQSHGANDTDVWLLKSSDHGETWSEPIRVNDDPPGKQQFFTWMAVDPTSGAVYIIFYDRRAYDNAQTDVYLAYSFDGGETFVNRRISDKPFTPQSSVFFGDYNNIAAYNGKVRPIWTRMDRGKTSIWTALIDFTTP